MTRTQLLYGRGGNRSKHPVSAFSSREAALHQLNRVLNFKVGVGEGDIVTFDGSKRLSLDDAEKVASKMWADHYFMADPPLTYALIPTDERVGLLTVSDD